LILLPLAALTACGGSTTKAFFCPNGPDFALTYEGEAVTILFDDGRTETLLPTGQPGTYAAGGVVWQDTSLRVGRLTDGQRSYNCDQSTV